jgi:non-ribosomal peptide synthase protein (TIGR01720 family)
MVPAAFVLLDALPLTPSGKLDRRALPPPPPTRPALDEPFVAPGNDREALLASIWASVLGLAEVGVHDDFFALGGDSILAIQIIARAQEQGLKLSPAQLFRLRTVAQTAEAAESTGPPSAEQGPVSGPVPLTPIQRWFFERGLVEPHHFNQAIALRSRSELSLAELRPAVAALIDHHDALRTRFAPEPGGPARIEADAVDEDACVRVDLSAVPADGRLAAMADAASRLHASLDPSRRRNVRVALIDFGPSAAPRVLLIAHHLVVDSVSLRILVEDLDRACQRLRGGMAPSLPPKSCSYREWAERLADHARSSRVRDQAGFWLSQVAAPVAPLPVDLDGGADVEASADAVELALDAAETDALLREAPSALRARVEELLVTALARSVIAWTGGGSLLLTLESHGREEELFAGVDLSRTVGWFTSLFPVRLELDPAARGAVALRAIKEQLRAVPDRGTGYGLLRYLGGDADLTARLAAAEPSISFNYVGQLDRLLDERSLFVLADEPAGRLRGADNRRAHLLEVSGGVVGGRLRLQWSFSRGRHRRDTVERLARDFLDSLRGLLAAARAVDPRGLSPSDFPEAGLSAEELAAVLGELGEGAR